MVEQRTDTSDRRIVLALAAVITVAWSVSFIADLLIKDYDPPPSVHALMMIVAGAVFGEGLLRSRQPNTKGGSGE